MSKNNKINYESLWTTLFTYRDTKVNLSIIVGAVLSSGDFVEKYSDMQLSLGYLLSMQNATLQEVFIKEQWKKLFEQTIKQIEEEFNFLETGNSVLSITSILPEIESIFTRNSDSSDLALELLSNLEDVTLIYNDSNNMLETSSPLKNTSPLLLNLPIFMDSSPF